MTKQLASFEEKNQALGDKKKLQMILVGYDQSAAGNKMYLKQKKIPFPAVKFDGRDPIQELLKTGETGFIPNVVLLNADGTLVSNDKDTVMKKIEELVSS